MAGRLRRGLMGPEWRAMARPRFLPLLLLVAVASACGRVGDARPAAAPSGSGPVAGPTVTGPTVTATSSSFHYDLVPITEANATTPEGAVYEAALRHEMFPPVEFAPDPPKILYILDRVCHGAGRGTSTGECDQPFDPRVAADLTAALADTVVVQFVSEERGPKGPSWMVWLSPVIIEGKAARVGIAYTDDPLCSSGTLAKLELSDERWEVTGGSFAEGCA